jgi:hypothetical protein
MGKITYTEHWLEQVDPGDEEEVYVLYMTVENDDRFGILNCT